MWELIIDRGIGVTRDVAAGFLIYLGLIRWALACTGMGYFYYHFFKKKAVGVAMHRVIGEVLAALLLLLVAAFVLEYPRSLLHLGVSDVVRQLAVLLSTTLGGGSVTYATLRRFRRMSPFFASKSETLTAWEWRPPLFPLSFRSIANSSRPDLFEFLFKVTSGT